MNPRNDDAPGQGSVAQTSIGSPAPPSVADIRSPFLTLEEVAERNRITPRTVRELTATHAIPHFKHPGGRRCLFRVDWLEAWESGSELEVKELTRGGRVVRPKSGR